MLWVGELWVVNSMHYLVDGPKGIGTVPAASLAAKEDGKREKIAPLSELRVVIDAEWWVHKNAAAGRRILA